MGGLLSRGESAQSVILSRRATASCVEGFRAAVLCRVICLEFNGKTNAAAKTATVRSFAALRMTEKSA